MTYNTRSDILSFGNHSLLLLHVIITYYRHYILGRFNRNTIQYSVVVTILTSLTVEGPSFVHETYINHATCGLAEWVLLKSQSDISADPQLDRHYILYYIIKYCRAAGAAVRGFLCSTYIVHIIREAAVIVRLSNTSYYTCPLYVYIHKADCVRAFIVQAVVTSCTHTLTRNMQRVYIDRHAHNIKYNI